MGLSSTQNRKVYSGDGSSTVFSFPLEFFSTSDLAVYLYDTNSSVIFPQTLNTNYTVSGSQNLQGIYPNGGNVVMNSAFPTGFQIVITRAPSPVNTYVLNQNSPINSAGLTQQFDYLTALVQRLQDEVSRCVQLPDGLGQINNSSFGVTLPQNIFNASSANLVLAVNSGANAITLFQVPGVASSVLTTAEGGTGVGTILPIGGIWYSLSASQLGISGAGATTQALIGGGSGAPTWMTYTAVNTGSTLASRDANGNATFVNAISTTTPTVASNQTVTMTAGSARIQKITGGSSITFNLPIATNLYQGQIFEFNNNASGKVTLNKQDGTTLVANAAANAYAVVICTDNTTSNGQFDVHWLLPNPPGSINQLIGANSGAVGYEFKTLTATAAGTLTIPSGQQIQLPNGSVSAPALTFSGSGLTNAGFYVSGSGSWSMAVGGAQAFNAAASASGFGNIGIGGSASVSDNYPLLVLRSQVGLTNAQLSNGDQTAGSGAKLQVVSDAGNNQMEVSAFTAATVSPDVYAGGRGAIRAGGSLTGVSIIADVATTSDVRLYAGGDNIANRVVTVTGSGGMQVGVPGSLGGRLVLSGSTSGAVGLAAQAAAGTWQLSLPANAGTNGQVLSTDGTGVASWSNISVTNSTSIRSANYVTSTNDAIVEVNSTNFTVTVYPAAGNVGKEITITKSDLVYPQVGGSIVIQGSACNISGSSLVLNYGKESYKLFSDGSNWQVETAIKQPTKTYLAVQGNGTYVPPTGCIALQVECIGGGGGGGGAASGSSMAGGGGGGGGYSMLWVNNVGSSYPYIVGNRGTGGLSGNNSGTAGSSTVFGSSVLLNAPIANGGNGGNANQVAGATTSAFTSGNAAGGSAANGQINVPGTGGLSGMVLQVNQIVSGKGGDAIYGRGGDASQGAGAGAAGTNGGGGAGGCGAGGAVGGGNGGLGLIMITEFYG